MLFQELQDLLKDKIINLKKSNLYKSSIEITNKKELFIKKSSS